MDASIGFIPMTLLLAIGLAVPWLRFRTRDRNELARMRLALAEALDRDLTQRARMRIAQEIHDELGRDLTKIIMLVAEVQRMPAVHGIPDRLDRIAGLSREMHSKLNDIIWATDPEHDRIKDLVEHARSCTDRIVQNASVRTQKNFVHHGPDGPIHPTIKRNIFLLLKEAVNNAIEYAYAQHIDISLETDPQHFKIHVIDDGVGFDPTSAIGKGNGLRVMKARCEELGAEFRLITANGKGCTIEVSGSLCSTGERELEKNRNNSLV